MFFIIFIIFNLYSNNLTDIYKLLEERKFDEAITKISNNYDENSLKNTLLAKAYQGQNTLDSLKKAEAHYFKALSLDMNNNEARLGLAVVSYKFGFVKKAELLAKEAIRVEPKSTDARNFLGGLMIDLKKFEEATIYFNEVKNIDEKARGYNLGLGSIAFNKNNIKEARELFEKEYSLNPKEIDVLLKLAVSYEKSKEGVSSDFKKAIKFYEKALEIDGENILALFNLSIAYVEVKNFDLAIDTAKKLLKLRPKNPIVNYNLSCFYSLKNNKKEALKFLKKAIELGYRDFDYIENDKDLNNLRNETKYKSIIKKYKK